MVRESKIDWITIFIYLLISLLGWANLYSTTMADAPSIFSFESLAGKQLFFIGVSVGLGILILLLDTKFLEISSYFFYGLTIVSLLGILMVAKMVSGANSWFEFGGFKLQPTEFAKVATVMALSRYVSRFNFNLYRGWDLLVSAGIILLPMLLVLAQNDAGSALVFLSLIFVFYREGMTPIILVVLALFAVTGVISIIWGESMTVKLVLSFLVAVAAILSFIFLAKQRFIGIHAILVGILLVIVWVPHFVVKPHHTARMRVLVASPEQIEADEDLDAVYYNLRMSMVAIGSGGLTGKGYGNATHTRGDFVPEEHSDYIHCVIGEEHGFLGSMAMLLLFLLVVGRLFYLGENSKSVYARVLAYGFGSIIFFHVFINVGMTIGLLPTVGIPLPFFSYGGSSSLAFGMMMFVMMNHYSYRRNILK